jgi:AcrR family transcriptional regulator
MSMTASKRRRPRRPRSTAPSPVEVAARLYALHGYRATTPELLAEAAGVAVADMPDRAALFAQVLERVRSSVVASWVAEPAVADDPETRLRLAARIFIEVSLSHPTEVAALHRALVEQPDEEIAASLQSLADETVAWLADLMSQGQQIGLLRRSLDPTVGAWHLLYTALGLLAATPLNLTVRARLDYLTPAIDCALHGLLKTDV